MRRALPPTIPAPQQGMDDLNRKHRCGLFRPTAYLNPVKADEAHFALHSASNSQNQQADVMTWTRATMLWSEPTAHLNPRAGELWALPSQVRRQSRSYSISVGSDRRSPDRRSSTLADADPYAPARAR